MMTSPQQASPLYTVLAVLVTPVFLLALAAYVIASVDSWGRSGRKKVGGKMLENVEAVLRWEWGGEK
jgi:hypothetical protein